MNDKQQNTVKDGHGKLSQMNFKQIREQQRRHSHRAAPWRSFSDQDP